MKKLFLINSSFPNLAENENKKKELSKLYITFENSFLIFL